MLFIPASKTSKTKVYFSAGVLLVILTLFIRNQPDSTIISFSEELDSEPTKNTGYDTSNSRYHTSEAGANASAAIHARRQVIDDLLGNYKYYIYSDQAIQAISTDLLPFLPSPDHKDPSYAHWPGNEATAAVWTHRALLAGERRTMVPADADLFVVPGYFGLSALFGANDAANIDVAHQARVDAWVQAVERSEWFKKKGGADHLFIGFCATNSPLAKQQLFGRSTKLIGVKGYTACFEMNSGWTQQWNLDRVIAAPYVANDHVVDNNFNYVRDTDNDLHAPMGKERSISIGITANPRKHAPEWAGCDRRQLMKLATYPNASIHTDGESRERISEEAFADELMYTHFCPLVCGDTPTSRRSFDAVLSACIPVMVGMRLFGECEAPCFLGWGWTVSGTAHPHLPWQGLWFDWTLFPVLNEFRIYNESDVGTLIGMARLAIEEATSGAHSEDWLRAYMATASNDFVYGRGDYRDSTTFGSAPIRIVETALLRIRNLQPELPKGFGPL